MQDQDLDWRGEELCHREIRKGGIGPSPPLFYSDWHVNMLINWSGRARLRQGNACFGHSIDSVQHLSSMALGRAPSILTVQVSVHTPLASSQSHACFSRATLRLGPASPLVATHGLQDNCYLRFRRVAILECSRLKRQRQGNCQGKAG